MKFDHAFEAVESCIALKIPVYLWGSPGTGKTALVKKLARLQKKELIVKIASGMDPADASGYGTIDGGWQYPKWLPTVNKPGIIFLDELNTAPPAVVAPLLQFVQDRKMGDYSLPSEWDILAAGNYESDRTFVHRLGTAMSNRWAHIDLDVDFDAWMRDWGNENLCEEIMAYLYKNPNELHNFDPNSDEATFESLRSWEHANKVWKTKIKAKEELLAGTIGKGSALKFIGFTRIWDKLPDLDAAIAAPDTYPIPGEEDSSVLYATVGSLIFRLARRTAEGISKYISRFPIEFQLMFIREGCRKYKPLAETQYISDFIAKHGTIIQF